VRIRTSEQALSNAAISIWNNTEGARTVLRRWHQELVFYANACSFQSTGDPARGVGVWTVVDDQVLDWMWNNRARLYRGELLNVKVYWLPMSYARLPLFPFVPPIVNHPDYISDGPRMPVPAHRGTRKVHVAYSTPLKTKQAAIASGVPGPLYALDMATGMACRQPQDLSSEINFDLDIKVQLYPPGMVDWEACRNPYHERRVRIHALFHEALVYAKRALESIRLPFHLACGTALCARQEIFDNDDTQRTRIPCDPDIVLQVVSCL
jgi:hypothetical protein